MEIKLLSISKLKPSMGTHINEFAKISVYPFKSNWMTLKRRWDINTKWWWINPTVDLYQHKDVWWPKNPLYLQTQQLYFRCHTWEGVKLLQHAHEPQVCVRLAETQPIKSTLNLRLARKECSLSFTISAEPGGAILGPPLKSVWKKRGNGERGSGELEPRGEILQGWPISFSLEINCRYSPWRGPSRGVTRHPMHRPMGSTWTPDPPPRWFGARRGAWHGPGPETLPRQAGNAVAPWGDRQRDKEGKEGLHWFRADWVRELHY